jgi:hypothetical protein
MKKYFLPVLFGFYSITLFAQQSPEPPPEDPSQVLITMAIVFAGVFLIAFIRYKKKSKQLKKNDMGKQYPLQH